MLIWLIRIYYANNCELSPPYISFEFTTALCYPNSKRGGKARRKETTGKTKT
jgi:hypothetical protein